MNQTRVRIIKRGTERQGPVVYWMSRDQRSRDNWALIHAQDLARQKDQKLIVVFCLVPEFLEASLRQYDFMIRGLEELEFSLKAKGIPFHCLTGRPEKILPTFLKKMKAGTLVTDFDPLKIKMRWKKAISKNISIPFHEVDTHNIVPCWLASDKQEFAARTFRPKINKLLPDFLEEFPRLKKQDNKTFPSNDWKKIRESLKIDRSVKPISWLKPGETNAKKILKKFVENRLKDYDEKRNDPNNEATSDLSPYLHFGQLSAQKAALEVNRSSAPKKAKDAFLEELIVRKELSDNFCFYNRYYDSTKGFPDWAKKTLKKHSKDKRQYTYTKKQFEQGKTHDPLWNAAQFEMKKKGKMHGYMRMYWAKKILEWASSPEQAMKIAIYLNDKYELDGRDPNGYTGVAWSIGGIHDRAWTERKIFGKVRFMSFDGCKRKFDIDKYMEKVKQLPEKM